MPDDAALLSALEALRDRGALGEASLRAAVMHAEAFLAALPPSTRRVIDLGSGGGLPGLVLAVRLPEVEFVLTDRRERRMDLLRLACARLGLGDRVTVLTVDVADLGRQSDHIGQYDAVTARSFAEPMVTARCAAPLLSPTGVLVVSEPPAQSLLSPDEPEVASRWPAAALATLGLCAAGMQFAVVRRLDRRPAVVAS